MTGKDCYVSVGGMTLQFHPASGFEFAAIADKRQLAFCIEPSGSTPPTVENLVHIRVSPLIDPVADVGFEQVLQHGLMTRLYRNDHDFLIRSFIDRTCQEPRWISRYGNSSPMVEAYTTEVEMETCVLPSTDLYPHSRYVLSWHLAARNGLWMHCAGAIRNGRFFVLTGRSGRGKSTLSTLLHESGMFEIASDEVNILRPSTDRTFHGFGTPWHSRANLYANITAPLHGLFFLEHAPRNIITEMASGTAMKKLLQQVYLPWYDQDKIETMLALIEKLVTSVPCYELGFRPDPDIADQLARFTDGL